MRYVTINRDHADVVVVTMNQPERLNAVNPTMAAELIDTFRALSRDRAARVVILNGAGRGFCSGYDLIAATDGNDLAPDSEGRGPVGSFYRVQQQMSDITVAIHECEKPVIGAIHGSAVGGGMAIALACDLRVAAPDTRFGAVFIKVGLTSCDMGVSYFLPRIVGATRAAELMLTGRYFGAVEADRFGLLNAVSAPGEHLAAAMELAEQIAANSEYGVWMTKLGLWANIDATSFRNAIELENRSQVLGNMTGNLDESAAAFRERRPAIWKPL